MSGSAQAAGSAADPGAGGDGPAPAEILVTAEDAYPAFERLVLGASRRVRASFRIFDATTLLRSEEAGAVGIDWFDLIVHKLRQGVDFEITITDFDPVARPELHELSWRSLRKLLAAHEAAGGPGRMRAEVTMHPARVGLLPRFIFAPRIIAQVRRTARRMTAMPRTERADMLRVRPGLQPMLIETGHRLRARRWPLPTLVPATHHQKIAVIDDAAVYVGGLDLNERRWDTLAHERPAPETWHDVQVILRAPEAVADAHRHLDEFLAITRGAAPAAGGAILRTLSARRPHPVFSISPRPVVTELRTAHREAIAGARDLIYFENQFFRDRALSKALARAGRAHPRLGLIMVLPGAPEELAFGQDSDSDSFYGEYLQSRAVDRVVRAFGERALILAPAMRRRFREEDGPARARLHKAPIIYVHAKVSIFDGTHAYVSSANLNGRSMSWDTECGVHLTQPRDVATLLTRCTEHWMGAEALRPDETGADAVRRWRALIAADVARPPDLRQGFLLPYPLKPARHAGQFIPVPEEMV